MPLLNLPIQLAGEKLNSSRKAIPFTDSTCWDKLNTSFCHSTVLEAKGFSSHVFRNGFEAAASPGAQNYSQLDLSHKSTLLQVCMIIVPYG